MRAALLSLVSASLIAGATTAQAGVSVDIDVHSGPPARYYPVGGEQIDRVWVPPVKQLVTQNVWHEPVTEDRVERTWVPDRYEAREVRGHDYRGRPVRVIEQVLVEPAHWEDRRTCVVVRAGYFGPETTETIIQPGYWQPVVTRFDRRDDDRFRYRYDDRRPDWHDHDRDDRRYDRR